MASNPSAVIPMRSFNEPLAPYMAAAAAAAALPDASTPAADPRLAPDLSPAPKPGEAAPPEFAAPAATPATQNAVDTTLSPATVPSPATAPEAANELLPNPPTPLKEPSSGSLFAEGSETPNGKIEAINLSKLQLDGNKKSVFYHLRLHNEHGEIAFDGPTDLSKVDVEKAVELKELSLELYPNSELPKEGEGLNKPATVKLYRMNPQRKGKPIDRAKFESKMKNSLAGTPSKHVSYLEEFIHGEYVWVWTFWVKNFNKDAAEGNEG